VRVTLRGESGRVDQIEWVSESGRIELRLHRIPVLSLDKPLRVELAGGVDGSADWCELEMEPLQCAEHRAEVVDRIEVDVGQRHSQSPRG
jgi:hypothetical protein